MSLASVAKGVLAQVSPFDNGATYGTYNNGLSAKPPTPTPSLPTPSYQPSSTSVDTSGVDKQIADSTAAIKALQAQLATQPKLPFYNTADAYARAQNSAQSVVNPVYTDKLNQYLQKAALSQQQEQQQTDLNKQSIASALNQTLQDNSTNRLRTGQDLNTSIGDVNQTEKNFQTDEGTQFDRARNSLLGSIANSGLTTSGIGQQQDANAISDRNQSSKEQTQQFSNQRRDANTLATRTFEDLGKSDTRAQDTSTAKTQQESINLKNYIDNAAVDETAFRTQNEQDRLSAVADQTNNQYRLGVSNFIAGLIGSGARSQDVQLAQQIYGI